MKYRGLIHFHSKYSFDSILSIKSIVDFALGENLNFLVLTDHDTLEGSIKLKEYVENNGYDIEVLIAAEYYTEYGDVIALDIKDEIKDMNFNNFISSVREQEGYILFPHPYVGHKNIEEIANQADLIETFNSRVSHEKNEKAAELANKFFKKGYSSPDAHNRNSLKNAIIEFKKEGSLVESMLKNEISTISTKKTFLYEIYFSQIVKSFKYKNLRLFIRMTLSILKNFLLLKLFKRV